jgi:predicted  nucleic acid-binding Zn-ribbon protein
MDSIQIIQSLKELQSIARASKTPRPVAGAPLSARQVFLRAEVPTAILGHFDRMLAQGRSGVAPLRDGICGGCHIRIPRAHIAGMRASHELDVCDQCGTFIYSEEMLVAATEGQLATAAS